MIIIYYIYIYIYICIYYELRQCNIQFIPLIRPARKIINIFNSIDEYNL